MDHEMKRILEAIEIPSELRERSQKGVERAKLEMRKTPSFFRKRLMVASLAVALIVPTGAFAYQSLLADDLYGSFDELKVHIVSATMEKYLLLDAKLKQAKGTLDASEYDAFKTELRIFTNVRMTYGDASGNVDYDAIPVETRADVKQALAELQPYFDTLNKQASTRERLTAEEYDAYIEAIMTEESIRARAGDDIEKMAPSLRKEYEQVLMLIRAVNEKQHQ
ncbi:DUF3600 domain-containing protein [Exiguobacterium sp. SH1S21]|uniref:DUF3600 domain-containing protein n=1 Tax=Exiguobacterium sp. SH1S21 TaxID=2510953 RepID=UPI00103CB600|nr:DUF3600 domain-containing protein [Exiguobacterium sp. SH1S21]TCI53029.1 DUF3600 domain-containing protein [Exiguobacterium sp. SH1S21]